MSVPSVIITDLFPMNSSAISIEDVSTKFHSGIAYQCWLC
jgi:hypothetical protein